MENKNYLNTQPDSNDIWKELGGNYENAEQSINELVDNAISNILGNNTELKKVQITLEETNDVDQAIIISIEDSGLGIKDAGEALTLGKAGSDSVLNEHGFGLIQALSAANKENDAWEIFNRSPENKANHEIMHIKAPYVMGKQSYTMESESRWRGHEWGSTLLIVRCNFKLFENLIPAENAVRPSLRFDFHSVADRIYEDLGFTYASLLEDKKVEMNLVLRYFNGKTEEYKVTAVTPLWSKNLKLKTKNCILNALMVRLQLFQTEFLLITRHHQDIIREISLHLVLKSELTAVLWNITSLKRYMVRRTIQCTIRF